MPLKLQMPRILPLATPSDQTGFEGVTFTGETTRTNAAFGIMKIESIVPSTNISIPSVTIELEAKDSASSGVIKVEAETALGLTSSEQAIDSTGYKKYSFTLFTNRVLKFAVELDVGISGKNDGAATLTIKNLKFTINTRRDIRKGNILKFQGWITPP